MVNQSVSVLANVLSFDWFFHYWPSKVNFMCVSTNHRSLVCLLVHSGVENEHSFPAEPAPRSALGPAFCCRRLAGGRPEVACAEDAACWPDASLR